MRGTDSVRSDTGIRTEPPFETPRPRTTPGVRPHHDDTATEQPTWCVHVNKPSPMVPNVAERVLHGRIHQRPGPKPLAATSRSGLVVPSHDIGSACRGGWYSGEWRPACFVIRSLWNLGTSDIAYFVAVIRLIPANQA